MQRLGDIRDRLTGLFRNRRQRVLAIGWIVCGTAAGSLAFLVNELFALLVIPGVLWFAVEMSRE